MTTIVKFTGVVTPGETFTEFMGMLHRLFTKFPSRKKCRKALRMLYKHLAERMAR